MTGHGHSQSPSPAQVLAPTRQKGLCDGASLGNTTHGSALVNLAVPNQLGPSTDTQLSPVRRASPAL